MNTLWLNQEQFLKLSYQLFFDAMGYYFIKGKVVLLGDVVKDSEGLEEHFVVYLLVLFPQLHEALFAPEIEQLHFILGHFMTCTVDVSKHL